jgi:outer membrane protein assembly factor BamB
LQTPPVDALQNSQSSHPSRWRRPRRPPHWLHGRRTGRHSEAERLADRVHVGHDADGDLVALGAADGSEVWRTALDASAETTPSVADETVYATDTAGTLHAVAAADGAERWTIEVGEPKRGAAVAVADDEVYVGTDSGLHAVTTGGERRWQFEMGRATTPTVGTDAVYVGERGFEKRSVFAVDRREGGHRWRRDTDRRGTSDTVQAGVRGPPTLVEGGVYVVADDGIRAFGR